MSLSGKTLNATWADGEKVIVYMMVPYSFEPSISMPMEIGTLSPDPASISSDGTNKMTLWSDSGKTIFDPCPQGWRVPTESEITGMGNANTIFTANNGFPASGYINTNGAFVHEANGTFWKTTIDGSNGRIQVVQGDYAIWSRSPDMGFNIRRVKE